MESKFMDNIKDDNYYINKILDDLQFVITHTEGKTEKGIICNELLVDSIMFRIIQIAENNSKLSAKEYHQMKGRSLYFTFFSYSE